MKTGDIKYIFILAVLVSAGSLWGQQSGGPGYETDWQGSIITGWFNLQHPPLPEFDMNSLMTVLLGMLGLGGMRSFEKFKGLTK